MTVQSNIYPTKALQEMDAAHHLHPFSDMKALNQEGSRIITSATGVWLTDSDGNRIMDGMAGLWCVQVGHGRTEIADAVHKQMVELSYYNTFFKTTHPPAIELSRKLAELAPPHINRVFYCSSGSEANDTVFRMVRYYWDQMGKPDKKVIISRWNGYHGSTLAGTSLGGMKAMHAQGDLPVPGVHHINQPYWFGEGGDMSPDEFGLHAARELEKAIDEIGENKVAAFIAEPIQGAGGVIIPPDTYWPEVQRILKERDILFVADEVICGFGRLGRWFGSDYYGIEPDLMPIAKGLTSGYLPMGGVLVSDRVAEGVVGKGGDFNHGYTYSGHPACAAAALANLAIIEREGLVERVANDIGPYLKERWLKLADHPLVGEARMTGLVGALELVPDKADRHKRFKDVGVPGLLCRDISFENGLVMRAVRDSMIISPPLVLSHEEADFLVATAEKTLNDTYRILKRDGWMG
ncbi:aspartate aminotransferase family protein [Roseibium aquae]|uniref:Aspartate aminotransferase family protein n=1 Tax=Roseibium aquae TaxID=1323746 RepID=A0A916X2G7_9HYPH|nr:aspartate aminotransferase family protein [Roseibium aquae]GGB53173.1 aspartate aminotransferase family protein [Roseibium aquae]